MYKQEWNRGRYVLIPHVNNLKKQGLEYKDILTYVTIRSFKNSDNKLCFPSHETIGKKAGMSKTYVINSIGRLESAGLVTVERSRKLKVSNKYYFAEVASPCKIPLEFFEVEDLTANQKGMLLCLRQFFQCTSLSHGSDTKRLANVLGLSYQQVYKQYVALVSKGFIIETVKSLRPICDKTYTVRSLNQDRINWNFNVEEKPSPTLHLFVG
ncbi:helix-turn-helix domain-containing protein [Daejeonella oryzae]|uniref:helix-turn-helix domain-containing protein n=1 Tax=Daejeonella oryzae TaxID=1122943 RepID=UPI00040E672A|nr:helix-turn-helix domain-containing protein [Daejeonella oryzae]